MNWIQMVGHAGALLTSITFIPQLHKAWTSKSVGDLSIAMMVIVFLSNLVWIVYGVTLMLWPVILANTVVAVVSFVLIYFKFAFKKSTFK
ncbi:MAG TPA: SemiSWEET family transporter [Cyclobacteriaceae bacterium]